MTIPHDATCSGCRFYYSRTDVITGDDKPYGDCYGLPPRVLQPVGSCRKQDRPSVADLEYPCSLFEAREEPDALKEALSKPGVAEAMRLQKLTAELAG